MFLPLAVTKPVEYCNTNGFLGSAVQLTTTHDLPYTCLLLHRLYQYVREQGLLPDVNYLPVCGERGKRGNTRRYCKKSICNSHLRRKTSRNEIISNLKISHFIRSSRDWRFEIDLILYQLVC